jgi:sialic acid synthase SpsE
MRPVVISDRIIGEGHPAFLIAEIGYNFRTVAEAKDSIDAAIDCGVDAVKFQTFRAETVTSRCTDFPVAAGLANQYDEFKCYEISAETHRELFDHARQRGILVFSTPSYFDDVDLLERLQVPVHKIGSDDLTNLPFIEYVAKTGKPVIFSTGMGNLAEVVEAVEVIRATGNEQIAILHCVSNYPVQDLRVVNLKAIATLRHVFGVPVGFSDHTTTSSAALGAVALGANLIERHFTISKTIDVPDAYFSADPPEMKALVKSIRELEQALGDGTKRPTPAEEEMRRETRKSTIARVAIRSDEVITQEKIIVKRPGMGVSPKLAHLVVGRRARVEIQEDEVITWDKLA